MWTYSVNICGPYGLWWYEENNIPFETTIINNQFTNFKDKENKQYLKHYSGGRIDYYCDDEKDPNYDPFNRELSLPIMENIYCHNFSEWLEKFKSETFIDSFEKLKEIYEKETGNTLILFNELTYK